MTNVTKTMSRLAATVEVTAVLALGAVAPALAASNDGGPYFYEPGANGSVWSYYPGYTAKRNVRQQQRSYDTPAYRARAQAIGSERRGRVIADDPPGSKFQTRGEAQDDMGCPC